VAEDDDESIRETIGCPFVFGNQLESVASSLLERVTVGSPRLKEVTLFFERAAGNDGAYFNLSFCKSEKSEIEITTGREIPSVDMFELC
jgi:hypothetical protein